MRRSLAVLASIGLGIGTIALASPAQATSQTVEASLSGFSVSLDPSGPLEATELVFRNPTTADYVVEGESVLKNGSTCIAVECKVLGKNGPNDPPGELTLTVATGASNATIFVSFPGAGEGGGAATAELKVTYSSGGDGSGSAPASEIQQFGLPASGNCEDGVTEAMNWSGVGLDGWGISWAQWANDGAGGAVCTRTVVYDTSSAKWVVN